MEPYTEMFKYVGSYLNTVEEVQPPPLHSQLSDTWWQQVSKDWEHYVRENELEEDVIKKSREVLECFQMGYSCLSKITNQTEKEQEKEQNEIQTNIQELLRKPQSVQRTDEWYREMKKVLSASEFYQLFGSPRARAQLVVSKVAGSADETSAPPRKCCLTMEMTALDWGIRFEPVAKLFLEAKWKASIAEMGRLHHPTRKGLAASPDGLIMSAEQADLIGDLVEIKCPSSRETGKCIPPSYWYQMQLQLEVSQRYVCQYCEFSFKSYTAQKPDVCDSPEDSKEKGLIYILQNEKLSEMKYEYGPLADMDWKPELKEGWDIVERIPWFLEKFWIQPVARDEAWFSSILPLIDHFWEDVEKARNGSFSVPESTIKKKITACAIID